jgi:hypothetical protein
VDALADHDKNLKLVMERCKLKGVKLNAKKMQLRLREVTYMGHLITADGLKVDPEKTKVIRDMPVPTDKSGVQRLLGMVNYVPTFAPSLAEITSPLRELVKKDNEFIWEEHIHGKALDQVRQTLSRPPVLRYFDPNVTPVHHHHHHHLFHHYTVNYIKIPYINCFTEHSGKGSLKRNLKADINLSSLVFRGNITNIQEKWKTCKMD